MGPSKNLLAHTQSTHRRAHTVWLVTSWWDRFDHFWWIRFWSRALDLTLDLQYIFMVSPVVHNVINVHNGTLTIVFIGHGVMEALAAACVYSKYYHFWVHPRNAVVHINRSGAKPNLSTKMSIGKNYRSILITLSIFSFRAWFSTQIAEKSLLYNLR